MTEDVPVASVQTALEVLEALSNFDRISLSELSEEVGMPKATLHDHLTTLRRLGYVKKDDSARYYPSTRFLGIGGLQRNDIDTYEAAKSKLPELSEETGEYSGLMIEENGYGVVLSTARGSRIVRLNMIAGMRTKLHTTGLGKAILASLPEPRLEALLDRHGLQPMTRDTITERAELDEELDRIRADGVAYDREERVDGLRSVGVPIASENVEYPGAIGIFGPANRLTDGRMEELVPKLKQTANVIEIDINYDESRL